MHVKHDQRLECRSQLCRKLATHELHNFENLVVDFITVLLHLALLHVGKDLLDALSPVNLIDGEDDLTRPFLHPLGTGARVVVIKRFLRAHLEC